MQPEERLMLRQNVFILSENNFTPHTQEKYSRSIWGNETGLWISQNFHLLIFIIIKIQNLGKRNDVGQTITEVKGQRPKVKF